MDADALIALAERVEQLAGPDREVDAEIWARRTGRDFPPLNGLVLQAYCDASPRYTASVDAAMTLVPSTLRLMLTEWDDDRLRARGPWQAVLSESGHDTSFDMMRGHRCHHAASAATALTAAALRAQARIIKEPQPR